MTASRAPRPPAAARAGLGAVLLAALALLVSCGGPLDGPALPRVRLATTTSARDTGLLEWLKPELRRVAGVDLLDVGVGTGQALELGRRGDADLVLVHDRAREDAFVAEGWGVERRDLMWNDFVLAGPLDDPAGVRGATAPEALARLAAARAVFVSRGDDSGAHGREKALWRAAGGRPDWPGYLESGQGQAPTLQIAEEKQAYVLSDRATYLSLRRHLSLVVLVEGGPALQNPYGVLLVSPGRVPGVDHERARRVLDYLVSPDGQARIAAFRVDGVTIFHPGAPPAPPVR